MTTPWTNAIEEIRQVLSDGPTDKERWRKRCIGVVDGVNTVFKTLESRRDTDFTTATGAEGVYINNVRVTVAADDTELGEFTLAVAPADTGVFPEATYYYRWFNDNELTTFLNKASEWLGTGSDYTLVIDGLQPAAMNWAAGLAYQKLSIRWSESRSDAYKLEDQPDPTSYSTSNPWAQLANQYKKDAVALRDAYYTRQGQALAPRFVSIAGRVKDVVPKR